MHINVGSCLSPPPKNCSLSSKIPLLPKIVAGYVPEIQGCTHSGGVFRMYKRGISGMEVKKSPSGVQGQSPGKESGGPPEAEDYLSTSV